jgi:2-C-methyl-D-erythritol 4-phosphate cytidylyltransferase
MNIQKLRKLLEDNLAEELAMMDDAESAENLNEYQYAYGASDAYQLVLNYLEEN